LGDDVSAFLGGLVIAKLQLTAMARASLPAKRRRLFFLLVDEFQNYGAREAATDATFAKIFTEARAFNLALICAHQYAAQLSKGLLDAIEHNVAVSLTCQLANGTHTLLYRQPQDPGRPDEILTPLAPLGAGDPAVARDIRRRSRWRYGRRARRSTQPGATLAPAQGNNAYVSFFHVP
jgi:hypothetical protein